MACECTGYRVPVVVSPTIPTCCPDQPAQVLPPPEPVCECVQTGAGVYPCGVDSLIDTSDGRINWYF